MRQEAMAVLASACATEMARLWDETGLVVEAELVRGPETGLVTVRGRIGGGGAPFNLGEATVTRATVRLSTGEVGHAYALGRDAGKATLSATIDAALQRADHAGLIEARVLSPLRDAQAEETKRRQAETAATKVDFFTMVRGED